MLKCDKYIPLGIKMDLFITAMCHLPKLTTFHSLEHGEHGEREKKTKRLIYLNNDQFSIKRLISAVAHNSN